MWGGSAMGRLALALGSMAAPAASAEPWHCDFTVECAAGGTCSEASHAARIIAADHEGRLFLSTVTGDTPVDRLTAPDTLPATYAGAGRGGLATLLTVEADGTALMTLHIFDGAARAATYFGTCEALR